MKKIVRLNERDLTRLIKRVIKEQELDAELAGPPNQGIIEMDDVTLLIIEGDKETVEYALSRVSKQIKYLGLIKCESANFKNLDLCSFPRLAFVNLPGTPNNFESVVECSYEKLGNGLYDMANN
jgi:hypothetical protein